MVKAEVSSVPAQEDIHGDPIPDPFGIVIFGASGDLSNRKLIPALFRLSRAGLLPAKWYVLGLGRSEMDDAEFRRISKEAIRQVSKKGTVSGRGIEDFSRRLHYLSGDSQDPGYYQKVGSRLSELDIEHQTTGNRLFYLATPPSLYSGIIRNLGGSELNQPTTEEGWRRIVVEKPFGMDRSSARSLDQEISQVFREKQVYRIDHYLGKETVQNILFLRFANAIFEPIWDRRYIDHIQITVAEDIGIEHRAGYYEQSGALRDMFQNHLLQLLCLVGMEPPASFDADAVRDERLKVIKALRPIPSDRIDEFAVRGQYDSGVINCQQVMGYRSEKGVKPDSKTETFAALKLHIDNWRWQGVRFYLRSGKRLPSRVAEIAIEFKRVPHLLFRGAVPENLEPNTLVIRIQPDEGISMTFQAKHPGPKLCVDTVTMDFNYKGSFEVASQEAYERLLLDSIIGDQTLFSRNDWLDLSWAFLTPILKHWQETPAPDFPNYFAGSWGPKKANELIEQDQRFWRQP